MLGIGEFFESAAHGTGSFFGSLIGSPFRAIAGAFRGVVNWMVPILAGAAAFSGIKIFTPDLWVAVLTAFGGKGMAEKFAKKAKEGGTPGMIVESLIESGVIFGTIGGVKGVIDSTSGQSTEGASGLGTIIGTVAAVGGIAYLVSGALRKGGVTQSGNGNTTTVNAPATPATTPTPAPTVNK